MDKMFGTRFIYKRWCYIKLILYLCDMKKDFLPYELALRMKQLDYAEPSFGYFSFGNELIWTEQSEIQPISDSSCLAPTWQQAFRWFREMYNLKSCIMFRTSMEDDKEYYDWLIKGQEVVYRHFKTYEEAELACLEKLIEIVEQKTEVI